LSLRFRNDGLAASGSSVSSDTLERRGRSWIVVVVVVVVIPDLIDAVSEPLPGTKTGDDADVGADADADADTDDDVVALGGLSAKGEPCPENCSGGGDGVPPDSRTVTVDVIVFAAVGTAAILLCVGAEDAMAPRPTFSSRVRLCLPARRLSGDGPSSPSSLRTSIARATPRPRSPSAMSERVRTMPPALTVLVVTPVLWNGSTLGAVRRAGESTERRPMFAPGRMSLGRRPCSDKALEKVEVEAVGRMRLWM
jgi:hypothetical protein